MASGKARNDEEFFIFESSYTIFSSRPMSPAQCSVATAPPPARCRGFDSHFGQPKKRFSFVPHPSIRAPASTPSDASRPREFFRAGARRIRPGNRSMRALGSCGSYRHVAGRIPIAISPSSRACKSGNRWGSGPSLFPPSSSLGGSIRSKKRGTDRVTTGF